MTPDKLEALRKLAADERTPIEEARNAALAFVRHGGNVAARAPTWDEIRAATTDDRFAEVFADDIRKFKAEVQAKVDATKEALDTVTHERDAAKKQLEELRTHGKALLAFVQSDPPKEAKPANQFRDPPFGYSAFRGNGWDR